MPMIHAKSVGPFMPAIDQTNQPTDKASAVIHVRPTIKTFVYFNKTIGPIRRTHFTIHIRPVGH